jgi:chromosome segregation ATPase
MAIEAIRDHYETAVARADMLEQLRAVAVERADKLAELQALTSARADMLEESRDQERTRAEAAEAELREMRKLVDAWKAAEQSHDDALVRWHKAWKENGGREPEPELFKATIPLKLAAASALEALRHA